MTFQPVSAQAVGLDRVRVALAKNFHSFLVRCIGVLHGRHAYTPAWHTEVLASRLQAVGEGKAKRLIVNVPPRHLKSLTASVALPAWLLGRDPSLAIVNVSYAQSLSDDFARKCRTIMASDWYRDLFPMTRLASAREPLAELATTEGGFRLATSVGGVLTGRGADVIIIDDPLKPAEAMSQSQRRAVNDWFGGTLYPRLNNKEKGAIVIVMQRLHEDDLVGHLMEQGGWERLSLPAIAEEDEVHVVETPFGRQEFSRAAGEALQPDRESLSTLETIRATMSETDFAAQYQQRPAPAGGGMVKASWFPRYKTHEAPAFERIVQSWDTANKASELADYSVCTTWGIKASRYWLIGVLRKKLSYPELKRAAHEQNALHRPQTILIEDRASGTQLIQDLIHEGVSRVKRYSPDGDKTMRLNAQTATMENGFVHLPDEAPWLADYLAELTVFPNGRHDDQVELDLAVPRLGQHQPRAAILPGHDGALGRAELEGAGGAAAAPRGRGRFQRAGAADGPDCRGCLPCRSAAMVRGEVEPEIRNGHCHRGAAHAA